MFQKSAIAIGIIGGEGAYASLLTDADIVVTAIDDALQLLWNPTEWRQRFADSPGSPD